MEAGREGGRDGGSWKSRFSLLTRQEALALHCPSRASVSHPSIGVCGPHDI